MAINEKLPIYAVELDNKSIPLDLTIPSDDELYVCRVVDYDGTVLKEEKHVSGDIFILPEIPHHDGLIAQGYSSPVDIVDGKVVVEDSDLIFGPMYTTASGLTEFDIELNKVTGLLVTLHMNGTKNWGDGSSDTATTHTYANYGKYTITCDGDEMQSDMNLGLFENSFMEDIYNTYCTEVRIGQNLTVIKACAFAYCEALEAISLPNTLLDIKGVVFYEVPLRALIVPTSITKDTDYTSNCRALRNVVIPNSVVTGFSYPDASGLDVMVVPKGVVKCSIFTSNGFSSITKIVLPDSCVSGTLRFMNSAALRKVVLPKNYNGVMTSLFRYCSSLISFNFPEGITKIAASMFEGCWSLSYFKIPSTVTEIKESAFAGEECPRTYDFSELPVIPTLANTNAFNYMSATSKIIVPDALYDEWKAATNWSTYANYIYKASEVDL